MQSEHKHVVCWYPGTSITSYWYHIIIQDNSFKQSKAAVELFDVEKLNVLGCLGDSPDINPSHYAAANYTHTHTIKYIRQVP